MTSNPVSISASRRAFYVDVMRCCACVMVVTSHVFAPICASFNSYSMSDWSVFNLFNALIRPSAALYVMISGKIFLGSSREDSYPGFVWKRYARLLPPFIVWSAIYAFYNSYKTGDALPWNIVVLKFWHGPTEYHLWFMYLILGLYLVMPLLRRFVRSASQKELGFALGVWFSYLVLQFVIPELTIPGVMNILVSYGGYVILGYALDKLDFSRQAVKGWALFGSGLLFFNAAQTYWLTLTNNGTLNETFYYGAAPLVALQGVAMFIVLKQCNEQSAFYTHRAYRWVVSHLSRHSYNVYLSHALFIWLLAKGDLGFILSEQTGGSPWIGVPLTTAAVLACSLGTSMLFQKIPVFSRLLVISAPSKRTDSKNPNPWPKPAFNLTSQ